MSEDGVRINVAHEQQSAPIVHLTRIQRIQTVEIMLTELNQIEEAATEEKTALSFLTLFLGALLSAVLGAPSTDASAARWGIYVGVALVCAIGLAWFFVLWLRKRKSAARILESVRSRAGTVQQTVTVSVRDENA
jgi:hypothetical protein